MRNKILSKKKKILPIINTIHINKNDKKFKKKTNSDEIVFFLTKNYIIIGIYLILV